MGRSTHGGFRGRTHGYRTSGFLPKREGRTKGGEALLSSTAVVTERCGRPLNATGQGPESHVPQWYVLWTQSNCELLVYEQLVAKGFQLFLPRLIVWSKRQQARQLLRRPMFPGYLFLRHAMDKAGYIEVRKARGLVLIVGDRWDRLAAVPDQEIESIQKVASAEVPTLPHPYLREGQRVRITCGPLAGAEGILVQIKPAKGLLILSVGLLRRSVAVQVDCTHVAAA